MGGGSSLGERERRAFSLLRRGHVIAAVEASDPGSVRLAVTGAEARVCLGRGDLVELERVEELVAASGSASPALTARLVATRADYHAFRVDRLGGVIAARALLDLPFGRTLTVEQLWARGRLHRAMASAAAWHQHHGPERSEALLERALTDFHAAGFEAEAARASADIHTALAASFGDGFERSRDIVGECLLRLRKLGSCYVDVVLGQRVGLDLAVGDIDELNDGLAELRHLASTGPLHPVAQVSLSAVDLMTCLMGEGATPAALAAADRHMTVVREVALPAAAAHFLGMAALLIDLGHIDPEHLALARRWINQAAAGTPVTLRAREEQGSVEARLDLVEHRDAAAVDAVEADIRGARERGLRRDAAQRGLRAALAARRIGRDDVADRLFPPAVADLPPVHRRTVWEKGLVGLVIASANRAPRLPAVELLGPAVAIRPPGAPQARPLSPAPARLVVALVSEGGAASAERLMDLLWPDVDLGIGQNRLRVALHRLRRALRSGADVDPLPRRQGLVHLAPGIDVDAVRFEALAGGDPAEQRAALELYGGDVAWSQLAYDDVAAPLRRRLAMRWRSLAVDAVADPRTDPGTLAHIGEVAARGADVDPALAELAREVSLRRARPAGRRGRRPASRPPSRRS